MTALKSEPPRAEQIADFLQRAGLGGAQLDPLPGDASTRKYARLRSPAGTPLMLMDAPPQAESAPCEAGWTPEQRRGAGYNASARLAAGRVEAFVAIADHLRGLGLSAPQTLAYDAEMGLVLSEDFGDALFTRRMEQGHAVRPHYETAVDVLSHLHASPAPRELTLPNGAVWPLLAYDEMALQVGAAVFLEWWPKFSGMELFSKDLTEQWDALWAPILARGAAGTDVFTHRDYHAENLLWLDRRMGVARVGLLDFQDAVRGRRAWDLLSLLQDARRDVEPELETAMLRRYLSLSSGEEIDIFMIDYKTLATLNNARILGVFARLITRDGKPRYRQFLPRMWRLLARNLEHPDLAGLRVWFDQAVPGGLRA